MGHRIGTFLLIGLMLLSSAPLHTAAAQDEVLAGNGYSPYSLFGFGDLVRQGTTYSLSMGGIGIGDRNFRYINLLNPAAVTAREAKSFMMDFGLENRNVLYQGNAATSLSETATGNLTSANNTFNMHHIVATLPIGTKAAFKLGVMPYSTVAYDFNAGESSDALIAQVGDITYEREGRGGVYQAVLGVGVNLWNRLSLGADANYYFGKIDRNSSAYFTTNASYRTINSGWSYNISCFGAKAGLQYTQPIKGASYFVVGATYGFDTKLRGHETRYAFGETSSVTDTIVFKKSSLEAYRIPAELGVGLTFHQGDRWLLGFDYIRQDWTSLSFGGYPGIDFAAGVSQSFRAGFEVTPNRYDVRSGFGHFLRRLTWRGGAYRELSYLTLGGSQVATTGITLGLGIPVFRYYNSVNLGVDLGQRGSISNSQIRERYFLFTVSFNLHDIWFIPTLYN